MGKDLAPGRGREGEDRGLNKQAEVGGWHRPSPSPDIQPLTAGRPPARAPGGSAATAHRPAPHRPPRSSFPPTPPRAGPRLLPRPRPVPQASPEGLPPRGARRPGVSRARGPSPEPGLPPSTGTFPKRAEAAQSPRAPLLQPVRTGKQAAGRELPGAGLVRGFALPHLHGSCRSALGLRSLPRASHIASAGCPSAPPQPAGGRPAGPAAGAAPCRRGPVCPRVGLGALPHWPPKDPRHARQVPPAQVFFRDTGSWATIDRQIHR